MRIGFVSFTGLVYDASTPYKKPLGGSESAICYLAAELAKRGHKVTLFAKIPKRVKTRGVDCVPMDDSSSKLLRNLDVLVVQNSPLQGFQIKSLLGKKTKLVFWTQHAHDQPAVHPMKEKIIKDSYDAVAVISKWQKEMYAETFNIPKRKMMILRNAISPSFEKMFKSKKDLEDSKKKPIMAYTSTPFRGLSLLVDIFPAIKKICPEVTLKIFSSMKVYQFPEDAEEKEFGKLYDLCRKTEGVEYVGSVSQEKLAKRMRGVTMLSYPNTFAETSCISVMEAMAAGCKVITSDLGALPETTAGFGILLPVTGNWREYGFDFIKAVARFFVDFDSPKRAKMIEELYKQVKYVNSNCTWKVRAKEWERWISTSLLSSK